MTLLYDVVNECCEAVRLYGTEVICSIELTAAFSFSAHQFRLLVVSRLQRARTGSQSIIIISVKFVRFSCNMCLLLMLPLLIGKYLLSICSYYLSDQLLEAWERLPSFLWIPAMSAVLHAWAAPLRLLYVHYVVYSPFCDWYVMQGSYCLS